MEGKLSLRHHKIAITFLVILMAAIGITFGIKTYGPVYLQHNVEIVLLTLSFVNTGLLLAIVGLLTRMGE